MDGNSEFLPTVRGHSWEYSVERGVGKLRIPNPDEARVSS